MTQLNDNVTRRPSGMNIDTNAALPITLEATIGEKIAILGVAGQGKSNTSAVILEEYLANHLPMTIVDIEGEYWGLKERYDLIIIGKSANVDLEVDAANAAQFATYSVEHGVSMILDLADYDTLEDMHEFLIAYFEALWAAVSKARRPYVVVLEEAHEFIPQGSSTPIKKLLTTFALRGRKRGVGMIIISQRSAKVEKSVLTQATFVFLHKVVHPTDLKVYAEILPLPPRVVEEKVGALSKGDALVLVSHKVYSARIRVRHTYHAGATPELDATQRTHIRKADDSLLAELRKLLMVAQEDKPDAGKPQDGESTRLRGVVAQREAEIRARQGEIARLNGEVERLRAENARLAAELRRLHASVVGSAADAAKLAPAAKRPPLPATPAPTSGTVARTAQANEREQRRWNALLSDLRRLPRYKKDILVWLLEREGTAYTTKQLARGLVLAESTIAKNPPLDLITMGLIKRNGTPGRYSYVASARTKLAELLPGMDAEWCIGEMIRRLR